MIEIRKILRLDIPFGAVFSLALLLLASCAAPVTVNRLTLDEAYQQIDTSALTGDRPSDATLIALRRHNLFRVWKNDPDAAIAALRQDTIADPDVAHDLFALAELSYLQGKRDNSNPDFLAAALYAYGYLDPGNPRDLPNPYDERFGQAVNIYNLSLTAAFSPPDAGDVYIRSGDYKLPYGSINLVVDPNGLTWHGRQLASFESTATVSITGIRNIYSNPGLGEPLAAMPVEPPQSVNGLEIAPRLRVPANLLLLVDQPRDALTQSNLTGRLVVHTMDIQTNIQIGDQTVPLEYNQTAARALSMAEASVWSDEYSGFLNGTLFDNGRAQLAALEPHQYGHMPVILIHGTASSPFRWSDMVNDLLENPEIRDHYEFWFFTYATGNPIPYSAWQLRTAVQNAITQLGGEQADPALGQITLIGHSQGGLLAKMLVIDPGDQLWNGISTKPLSQWKLSDQSRQLLQETMFPTAIPEVKRVIFIATPQRGSYVAAFSLARFIGRLVRLPISVEQVGKEVLTGNSGNLTVGQAPGHIGSVYGMSPNSPFIKSLAAIPIAPGVHVHSIIPVATNGPLWQGNDGVVAYSSAHIDGVDSELVVHSSHSTQSNPATIAEVQRILLLQLQTLGQIPATSAGAGH